MIRTFRPNFLPWLALGAILLLSGGLMINSSRGDAAIMDELAHIPAGYSYVRYLDYRLNPEHPPLVKALAGIPLLFGTFNFPLNHSSWTSDLNGQWDSGRQFLYHSGNNADTILFLARLGPIFLTLATAFLIYWWSKELIGRWWGLVPALLFALSPNILAHGHYVTTDIAATFGALFAVYFYVKFLEQPTARRAAYAGAAFGVAQLLKFSMVLLAPHFALIAVLWFVKTCASLHRDPATSSRQQRIFLLLRDMAIYSAIFAAVATFTIYAVYLLLTWNYPIARQYSDTKAQLHAIRYRQAADAVVWMSGNRIFRPMAQYLLGVFMVAVRAAGGNTNYFLGSVTNVGTPYYFPLVFLMKESIPSLLILAGSIIVALVTTLSNLRRGISYAFKQASEYLELHFAEFSMLAFVAIYWISSIRSPLNIGVRHIIPTLPFVYIVAAGTLRNWFFFTPDGVTTHPFGRYINMARALISLSIKYAFLAALLIIFITESIHTSPYFLSYFNRLFGGVANGYEYVTDSNYDWGQDMKRLTIWADANVAPGETIAVDYFGGGDAQYYLGSRAINWRAARGNPKEEGIRWLALSVNTLQSSIHPTTHGFVRNPADEYSWLENPYKPYAKAGTSIFIYKMF